MPNPTAPPLAIQLFGPLGVQCHGAPLPRLRSRNGLRLLALLTLRHGREVERAWLAGTLWPDMAAGQGLALLRRELTDLRRALGPEAWRVASPTPRTLRLELPPESTDVVAFDEAMARGDPASLARAVGLRRGPLLEGCAEEWVFQERQVREEAYLAALERLAAEETARGEHGAAMRYLRLAVTADPLRETAQRGLMQALAGSGEYGAAALAYRELRELLHRELNAEPAPETSALYQQIRAEARSRAQTAPPALARTASSPAPGSAAPDGTLTFLFTDIEGSTRLWEEHPDAMRSALERHHAILTTAIEQQGGFVVKRQGEGDSFFAVFSRATDAVTSACILQLGLLAEPWPPEARLPVRVALHTGEADLRGGDYFGPAVNRCARLRAAAHGGQVLISLATQQLVQDTLPPGVSLRDLGAHRLRDLQRPEQVFQLLHPGLPADFPSLQSLDGRPNNLPVQPTPLVGREQEVAAARDLLRQGHARLLTLTGPGGTGKTRLGLQVAAELLDDAAEGVFVVELAPITDPGLVISTIASVLGVRPEGTQPILERLKEYLREKQMLLMLDNFEQVSDAAPQVAELLGACPRLQVLVTSRAPLHLRGEHEFPVPPLSLPDPQHLPPPEALSQYAAVELFIQRAVAVKPDFGVTNENAPAVAEICHRLDGLPLAIELAAARVKLMPPQALLGRLDSRLKMLTGGARDLPERQRTLRSAIAWSYDLLEPEDQALFRGLAIFVGGCTLEAAEAVCADDEGRTTHDERAGVDPIAGLGRSSWVVRRDAVLDGIASLVDKSLLRQQEGSDGEIRVGMLETIREYGLECLTMEERARLADRHLVYFVGLAEQAEAEFAGVAQMRWLERLDQERANVRAALAWAVQSQAADPGLRLGGALWWFWDMRGLGSEGREPLGRLLALPGAVGRTALRAKALAVAGRAEEGLAVGRECGDLMSVAMALRGLSARATREGNFAKARSLLVEGLAVWQQLGNHWGVALSISLLGENLMLQGDRQAARPLYEEALAIRRKHGDREGIAYQLLSLGRLAMWDGDFARAHELLRESLAIFQELRTPKGQFDSRYELAWIAALHGDYAAAEAGFEENCALARDQGRSNLLFRALIQSGRMARFQGGDARAAARFVEVLTLGRATGSQSWIADAQTELGMVALHQCDYPRAVALFVESLHLLRELGRDEGVANCLIGLAGVAAARGGPRRAAQLLGAARALLPSVSGFRPPLEDVDYERVAAAARAALGEDAFADAWGEGQALALDQAVALALADPSPERGE